MPRVSCVGASLLLPGCSSNPASSFSLQWFNEEFQGKAVSTVRPPYYSCRDCLVAVSNCLTVECNKMRLGTVCPAEMPFDRFLISFLRLVWPVLTGCHRNKHEPFKSFVPGARFHKFISWLNYLLTNIISGENLIFTRPWFPSCKMDTKNVSL